MGNGPWNDATDRQLLLTIIHLTAPKLPNWAEVAEKMGDGFTSESTRQHFQKMRKELGKSGTSGGGASPSKGTPTPSVKGTPSRKPKAVNGDTPGGKSTGKRKSSKKDTPMLDCAQDDDEENESPSKKVKVKAEVKADEDAGSDAFGDWTI